MDFDTTEDLFIGEVDESGPKEYTPTKDETLFLIDCSAYMLQQCRDGEVPYFMVLQAAVSYFKDKIFAAETDNLGIVLYNTEETNNHMGFPGIYVLQELGPPSADRIQQLNEIIKNRVYNFGHQNSLLVNSLWLAHNLLVKRQRAASRRIFLFTDDDNPNADHPVDQLRAQQRAKDLAEQDIFIELFPFNRSNEQFNFNTFYSEVVALPEDEPLENIVGSERLQDLIASMHKKEFKKRTLGRLMFQITPQLRIAMGVYCMLRATKKPTPMKLHADTNKKLKTITSWICQESGKQLWTHDLGTHFEFGGHKILFNKEEMNAIKRFDGPGITLMGFKDRSRLKPYMNVRASYFLYPNEEKIKGSSQVCHSLLIKMLQRNKIAIVKFIPRENALVKFGAMVPSTDPPGFHLIFLPYADDMRTPQSVLQGREIQQAPDDVVNLAANMTQHLRITEFDISSFYHPDIQHFYSNLEALALETPLPPPVQDSLEPDYEGMQKHAQFIDDFFAATLIGKRQRPAPAARGRGKTQAKKEENGDDKYTAAELRAMKVNELKDICGTLGLRKVGKKDDLIQSILDAQG